jgi:polysaccharide export outer membrane protein
MPANCAKFESNTMAIHKFFYGLLFLLATALSLAVGVNAHAQKKDYQLGAGDVVKITVFQNPDLTTETRVSESGAITFPLVGEVQVGGLPTSEAEKRLAQRLKDGGFVQQAQVNIVVKEFKSVQVSVLGQVNRPGRYPVEGAVNKITDMLALAGGVTPIGGDTLTLVTTRSGKEQRMEIDLPAMFNSGDFSKDMAVSNGDLIFVPRAELFYIYGEVQKPGGYRLERNMTVMQALSVGGGLTVRGTERRVKLHRRDESGKVTVWQPKLTDFVRSDDVIYVNESFF